MTLHWPLWVYIFDGVVVYLFIGSFTTAVCKRWDKYAGPDLWTFFLWPMAIIFYAEDGFRLLTKILNQFVNLTTLIWFKVFDVFEKR